ncbi:hypothetical protein BP5796_01703 [Neofusicoccum parvum]|uniref:Uncharacterized protein n=1 Tax=Neofusicoccum parvum TaxID=310453 RepID=A0ACB5SNB3_9PEZI|nr:hypothetical protein BP5796_01703 [Neofusicoccum parvum]
MPSEDVSFKTLDGITICGALYPAAQRGPAVVMTPGFNCVKEMLLPEVAEAFQQAGITALIYDPRSIGLSGGIPRNEIDPVKQTEDYSDALTYLTSLPTVDPNRVGFWGMSFSGMIALSAAALDKRAKFVIVVCGLVKFYNPEKVPKALAMAIKDRQSQLRGNPPFYLPPFTSKGSNPLELAAEGGIEAYNYMVNVKDRGAPNYEDRTTMQSYAKIAKWQPHSLMKFVDTPVLGMVPEFDKISPTDQQLALFDELACPKKVHVAKGKSHLNILSGEDFGLLQQVQVDFLNDVLMGKFA